MATLSVTNIVYNSDLESATVNSIFAEVENFLNGTTSSADVTITGVLTAAQVLVDNLSLNGNTLSSTSGILSLTPVAGSAAVIDSHFSFDGTVLTAITDNNTTITAYAGKNITIEGVTFDGGVVTGISTLTLSGAVSGVTTLSMSGQLTSTLATGTAPFVVSSTTEVANLSISATNLTSGTVPSARVSGSYTGITAVGTLTGLAISGTASFRPASNNAGVTLLDSNDSAVNMFIYQDNSGGAGQGGAYIGGYSGATQTVQIASNALTGKHTYFNAANVNFGIGTSSPAYKLDVTGTTNITGAVTLGSTLGVTGAATFSSTSTFTGNILNTVNIKFSGNNDGVQFKDSFDSAINMFIYQDNSGGAGQGGVYLRMYTGATATIQIASNTLTGRHTYFNATNVNFGIGTSSPAYKLDVTGTTNITGAVTLGSTVGITSTLTLASSGGSGLRVYGGSGTHQWDIYLSSTGLRLTDNTSGGVFTIDTAATIVGDFYTTAWTDYSGSSTVTGWSSTTTKIIRYKKVGRLVFITFHITGTSNTTGASFTVADAAVASSLEFLAHCNIVDNGGAEAVGRIQVSSGASTVTVYKDVAAAAFTNSGTKTIMGQFWYEAAA